MVSVIIPCYNAAKHLERAVKSVLQQNVSPLEVILVNNNSTDNTEEVIQNIIKEYSSNISIINANENKKGACAARNRGLSLAKYEYIQFLDADDEILNGKIFRQIELAKINNADIISGTYEFIADKAIIKRKLKKPLGDNWKGLISSQLGITSANLWRRESLINVGGWNEDLSSSQEYDLLFRLLKSGNKLFRDNILSTYVYAEDNSVSRSSNIERTNQIIDNYLNLRFNIKRYLQENHMFSKDLEMYYNITLYRNLLYRKQFSPKYVNKQLNKLDLQLPFFVKVVFPLKNYILKLLK